MYHPDEQAPDDERGCSQRSAGEQLWLWGGHTRGLCRSDSGQPVLPKLHYVAEMYSEEDAGDLRISEKSSFGLTGTWLILSLVCGEGLPGWVLRILMGSLRKSSRTGDIPRDTVCPSLQWQQPQQQWWPQPQQHRAVFTEASPFIRNWGDRRHLPKLLLTIHIWNVLWFTH